MLPGPGAIICVVLWIGIDIEAKILGLIWLGLGVVYIAVKSRGFRRPPTPIDLAEKPEPTIVEGEKSAK